MVQEYPGGNISDICKVRLAAYYKLHSWICIIFITEKYVVHKGSLGVDVLIHLYYLLSQSGVLQIAIL